MSILSMLVMPLDWLREDKKKIFLIVSGNVNKTLPNLLINYRSACQSTLLNSVNWSILIMSARLI